MLFSKRTITLVSSHSIAQSMFYLAAKKPIINIDKNQSEKYYDYFQLVK